MRTAPPVWPDPNEQWKAAMRSGRFDQAWQINDALRLRQPPFQPPDVPRHLQMVWNGSAIEHRRVLVRCYHGLGDTIQFIRYAPWLRARAREVVVWAQPELLPLLHGVTGIDRVIPMHDGRPDWPYEVDLEVMELPYVFRSTVDTVPTHVPYIRVAGGAVSRASGPAVGLVWRGGAWSPERSVPFSQLGPLFDASVTWHLLQAGMTSSERALAKGIWCGDLTIENVAPVVASLDLLITIDSMPAHLAGALGVPVWTLLHDEPDWRWMLDRDDTPWYPTMRLFRQSPGEGWPPVLARVLTALQALAPPVVLASPPARVAVPPSQAARTEAR